MAVPAVNIVIEKGTDFEAIYNVSNSDNSVYSLTNQAATAKIRKHPTATTSTSFTTTITTATGEIKISMSAANTALLTAGRNYYDVILTHSVTGKKIKIFEGTALVHDTVSV
jgi:hypothetical protein